jgi:hypothetical protein
MANLHVVITADRQAVGAFVDAARRITPARWAVPRAAGKCSPGQVTEHVALTYEQSRRMLLGTFTGPVEPWFRQLLARWLFLRPMFKRGDFGKGASLAPDFIQPTGSPASSGDLWLGWKRPCVISKRISPRPRMLDERMSTIPFLGGWRSRTSCAS